MGEVEALAPWRDPAKSIPAFPVANGTVQASDAAATPVPRSALHTAATQGRLMLV